VLFIIKNKISMASGIRHRRLNALHGLIAVASKGRGCSARLLLAISVDEGKPAEIDIPIEAGTV
jgi:hypothetical protein